MLLDLMNNIMRQYDMRENIKSRGLEEKTELLIEANDNILERVADNLDIMNGIKKNGIEPVVLQAISAELPVNGSWNRTIKAKFSITAQPEKMVKFSCSYYYF